MVAEGEDLRQRPHNVPDGHVLELDRAAEDLALLVGAEVGGVVGEERLHLVIGEHLPRLPAQDQIRQLAQRIGERRHDDEEE